MSSSAGNVFLITCSANWCRFLLAEFQIKYVLDKREPRMMKDALNSLPATLENAYQRIIDRIGEKGEDTLQLAWRILSWVFHAARPLRMYEIREAISVRLGDNELDEQDFLHPDDIVDAKVCWFTMNPVKSSDSLIIQCRNFSPTIVLKSFSHASS
jgi:hypothetical protein